MVALNVVRRLAREFPNTEELPHFEKRSFRIKKKIFATLDEKNRKTVVKLTPVDQSAFCAFDPAVIYPAAGLWGKHGWTVIELRTVKLAALKDALTTAYTTVSGKKK